MADFKRYLRLPNSRVFSNTTGAKFLVVVFPIKSVRRSMTTKFVPTGEIESTFLAKWWPQESQRLSTISVSLVLSISSFTVCPALKIVVKFSTAGISTMFCRLQCKQVNSLVVRISNSSRRGSISRWSISYWIHAIMWVSISMHDSCFPSETYGKGFFGECSTYNLAVEASAFWTARIWRGKAVSVLSKSSQRASKSGEPLSNENNDSCSFARRSCTHSMKPEQWYKSWQPEIV